jgi:thiamine kinase-like enzyme
MALEPGSILDGWRGWDTPPASRPAIVRELGGGRSNRSFLLESAGEKMVLRVNATQTILPANGRVHETVIWRAASEAGIAPPLLHADRGGGFLVSAYIESDLPARPQDGPVLARKALGLLQRCHRIKVDAPIIDYSSYIEAYWQTIEADGLKVAPELREQREAMHSMIEEITAGSAATVLCHHDPVVENFVGTPGRLYLVDWEYAARGLAVMDYAAFAVEWDLDDAAINAGMDIDSALLAKIKAFYRYLCDLWEMVSTG